MTAGGTPLNLQPSPCACVPQDMVARGCERNVITYSSLIAAAEKAGRWELALEMFSTMHREGCTPNVVTYNSLIAACANGAPAPPPPLPPVDPFSRPSPGIAGNLYCYLAASAFRVLLKMLQLWTLVKQPLPRRTDVVHDPMRPASGSAGGQWEKAADVFDQMTFQNCKPDGITYSALISAYSRAGQWRRALKAFELMQQQVRARGPVAGHVVQN